MPYYKHYRTPRPRGDRMAARAQPTARVAGSVQDTTSRAPHRSDEQVERSTQHSGRSAGGANDAPPNLPPAAAGVGGSSQMMRLVRAISVSGQLFTGDIGASKGCRTADWPELAGDLWEATNRTQFEPVHVEARNGLLRRWRRRRGGQLLGEHSLAECVPTIPPPSSAWSGGAPAGSAVLPTRHRLWGGAEKANRAALILDHVFWVTISKGGGGGERLVFCPQTAREKYQWVGCLRSHYKTAQKQAAAAADAEKAQLSPSATAISDATLPAAMVADEERDRESVRAFKGRAMLAKLELAGVGIDADTVAMVAAACRLPPQLLEREAAAIEQRHRIIGALHRTTAFDADVEDAASGEATVHADSRTSARPLRKGQPQKQLSAADAQLVADAVAKFRDDPRVLETVRKARRCVGD